MAQEFIARKGLIALDNSQITGSLSVTGTVTGSIFTGSFVGDGSQLTGVTGATTASYVEYSNVANKPTLVSGSSQITYSGLTGIPSGIISGSSQVSFNGIVDKPTLVSGSSQITYSGLTGIPSGIVSGSSQVTYSGLTGIPSGIVSGSSQITYSGLTGIPSGIVSGSAQVLDFGIFATTGSNGFNGSQSITGSLTVTGQVVAQTLNVQQVTSSIVYSSGSNIFGNSLSNTQQFTGSVGVTGSLTINGTSAVVGSGSANYVPKFTAGSTIGNSIIQDLGSSIKTETSNVDVVANTVLNTNIPNGNKYISMFVGGTTAFSITPWINSGVLESAAGTASNLVISNYENGPILFQTNDRNTKLTLSATGNLGLGVTPSAWDFPAVIQLNTSGAFLFGGGNTILGFNAYFQSGWKYVSSNFANYYEQNAGEHRWFNAPSGTAGNAISFTQAMTLNASGNLSIGNTNDTYKLDVTGTARFTGQVNSETAFYAVATPPATNGGLINVRDTVTAPNVTSFAGVFFNSSPGNDYSIGKLTENNAGFLQIRNANNGAELLRINSIGAATFSNVIQSYSSQPIYLFSTPTDSNYEVLAIDKSATDARIRVYKSGTGSYRDLIFETGGSTRLTIASTGAACFACELTAKSLGTNDLILNNLNHDYANYVDGTRGSWLIQEGACDLFIINQVSCKKYKFNLIEIK